MWREEFPWILTVLNWFLKAEETTKVKKKKVNQTVNDYVDYPIWTTH